MNIGSMIILIMVPAIKGPIALFTAPSLLIIAARTIDTYSNMIPAKKTVAYGPA